MHSQKDASIDITAEIAPPFTALSHCWEQNEVTFADLRDHNKADLKAGYAKLRGACQITETLGFQWLWADTVCINRASSAELTESVNSTFQWYRQCQVCIVYLGDLPPSAGDQQPDSIKAQLSQCRWVRRAWTLQELIAPNDVRFYDESWSSIGSKESLGSILSDITRIDLPVLENPERLSDYSIARIMSWAANREALHMEDIAYSLVGLFGVSLPVVYGEGRRAFIKLQEEIMKETDDASLFAWQSDGGQEYRGLLARDPSEFSHFASRASTAPLRIRGDIFITSAGFTIEDEFGSSVVAHDAMLGLFNNRDPNNPPTLLGVQFRECNDRWVRSNPEAIVSIPSLPTGPTKRIRIKRDIDERTSGVISRDISHGGNAHYPSVGKFEAIVPPPRAATWNKFTPSSFLLQQQSPGMGSPNIGVPLNPDYTESTYTETNWSTVGTIPTSSFAPLCTPCNPNYINSTSAVTSPGHRCVSPETMGCHDSVRDGEGQISVYHDTASNCDDSGEDDMPIFTASPLEPPKLDPGHPFEKLTNPLAEHALEIFPGHASQNLCSKRGKKRATSSANKRRKSESFEAHVEIHGPLDLEDEDLLFIGYRKPYKPSLSCPFLRHDPKKYQSCLTTANLQSIKAVKQHLWNCHRRPYFCSVCRDIFDTAAACSDHVRKRACALREEPKIEGITEEQVQALALKPNLSTSIQEQWFAIWDIIFPGGPRPLHPFLTGNLETLVCLVREYWASHGKEIIGDFLESRKMRDYYEIPDEERNLEALYEAVLNIVVDRVVGYWGNGDSEETHTSPASKIMDMVRWFRFTSGGYFG